MVSNDINDFDEYFYLIPYRYLVPLFLLVCLGGIAWKFGVYAFVAVGSVLLLNFMTMCINNGS